MTEGVAQKNLDRKNLYGVTFVLRSAGSGEKPVGKDYSTRASSPSPWSHTASQDTATHPAVIILNTAFHQFIEQQLCSQQWEHSSEQGGPALCAASLPSSQPTTDST